MECRKGYWYRNTGISCIVLCFKDIVKASSICYQDISTHVIHFKAYIRGFWISGKIIP